MKQSSVALLCAWGLVAIVATQALGDGVVVDGVGATSGGRGGTNIANADNGAVLLDNPAGIVNIDGCGLFELGLDGLLTDLDYSDPENSTNAKFRPMALPHFSYIRKSCDGDWAAGLGVYAPAGFGAQWSMNQAVFGPDHHGYKSIGALVKILPGIAYRLTDELSIGATLGVGVSHAELEGPFFLQNPSPSPPLVGGIPTRLDLQATGAAPTWSVGMQYQLSERTTLGLAYTDETRFRLNGNARTSVLGLAPVPVESKFDADVDLVWPRSLGLGVKHDLCACQRLSVDVVWFDWSHAFDHIDMKLTDSSNPAFGPLTPIRDSFPLDWDDSVSLRIGYELFSTPCDVWRLGYVYNSRNIPSSTLTPYIPAILEHSFTVGYGKRWGNWTFDTAYQFSFSPERHVDGSDLVGGDFDNSEVKAQAHWLLLSASYRW
ncbi:MAG: outer membrane protein transport protein [Planctomycetes bacterium]|nr:outer membrane protein transport protein [Planctomycetota bacterium]